VSKAQLEEHFCFMYADLCRKIIDSMQEPMPAGYEAELAAEALATGSSSAIDGGAADDDAVAAAPPSSSATGGETAVVVTRGSIFRQLLLNRCRDEFEFDRVAALAEIRAIPDTEIDEAKRTEKEIGLSDCSSFSVVSYRLIVYLWCRVFQF
jgi:hypothetical protein